MNYQAIADKLFESCHKIKEMNEGAVRSVYPLWFKVEFSQTHFSLRSTPFYQEFLRQLSKILPSLVNQRGWEKRCSSLNPNALNWTKQYQAGELVEENAVSISHRVAAAKPKPKADPITRLVELKSARESMEAEIRDMQAKVDSIKAQQIEIMKEFIG